MSPLERRDTARLESLSGPPKPMKELRDRVVLNVGGKVFEPYISTLKNIPDIPLARILDNRSKLDFDPETGEYFFDRHPAVFQQVLNYLQTGKLHCPRNICGPLFEQELAYWGLDEQQMESCCWPNYTKHRDAQENLQALDFRPKYENADDERPRQRFYNDPNLSWWQRNQPIVWEILDDPYSSSTAKVLRICIVSRSVVRILTLSELYRGIYNKATNVYSFYRKTTKVKPQKSNSILTRKTPVHRFCTMLRCKFISDETTMRGS